MAVRNNKVREYKRENYIDGNIVRNLQPLPDGEYKNKRIEREHIRRNRERQMQMNPGYVLFLLAAVIVSLLVCVKYIQVRAEITSSINKISSLENELVDLKSDNDADYNRVLTSVNLENVKRIAIEEYGMVYAGKDQIVKYKTDEDDYMNQYKDIPE